LEERSILYIFSGGEKYLRTERDLLFLMFETIFFEGISDG